MMCAMPKFIPQNIWLEKASPAELIHYNNAQEFYDFVNKRRGYVYAMRHPDRPTLLKIGYTTKNPHNRAHTMGTAGILGAFSIVYFEHFANVTWAEAEAHRRLSEFHVDKEFFEITKELAKQTLDDVLDKEHELLRGLNREYLLTYSFGTWNQSLDTDSLVSY